jgi:uncharacterized repeat protein (TIGR03803 family)
MNTPLVCAGFVFASLLLSPSGAQAAWKETNLVSFNGTNGNNPDGGLIFDARGNLYGTTFHGGTSGNGDVFRLTPPAPGKTAWTETVLYTFSGTNGKGPNGNLIFDSAGNLYGTTVAGGAHGDGTVFKLTPPAPGKTAWTETVLLSFNGTNGNSPRGSLVRDKAGNLYGAAAGGGAVQCNPNNGLVGCGTIFKLTPPAAGKTAWTETTLVSFKGTDGSSPNGGLVFDSTGSLYGTTGGGPTYLYGTVFKLTPPAAGKTAWTETVLFAFNGTNGKYPDAGLAIDTKGNLYGTTEYGGSLDAGAVFKLTRPAAGKTAWGESVLASFAGASGDNPNASLILDAAGNLYGTTEYGGGSANNFSGNVFRLTPPAAGKTAWTETVLYTFKGDGSTGLFPSASLARGGGGGLFGTAFSGGKSGHGVVFRLTP